MLTEENIMYFGPKNDPLPLTLPGRMDPALWLAGKGRARAAMRFLKDIGVDNINARCITGNMTLLHIATMQNQARAVRTLLKAKADPEARDDQQRTCAMIASTVEHPEIIRVLCEEGPADPNATTHFEETALHLIGQESTHHMTHATILALLDSQANPNAKDTKGQTPLFSFTVLEKPSVVKLLCSRGADPHHRNLIGRSPLHTLFEVCLRPETAVVLVKRYKVDVNAQDINGVTPLMLAAHTRSLPNVKALLEVMNANPMLRDSAGHDALWYAKDGIDAPMQARAVVRMIEMATEQQA
jgi:ankyrin repeat protein